MMSTPPRSPTPLRNVLYELALAKPAPDAALVDEFVRSYPEYASDLTEYAIKLALDTTLTPRPMSHDLVKSFMEHLNVTVRRVVIGDVKNSTYYATVYLENNGVERTVDARPSDAISLALRTRAPLYVSEDVIARRNTANLESWLAKQDVKSSSKQPEV